MNKIIASAILLSAVSCTPNTKQQIGQTKDSTSTNAALNASPADTEERRHLTFNEPIEVPESLRQFVPAGYEGLKLASGDLNLDRIEDRILVLRKPGEETNFDEQNPDKRPMLLLLGQQGGSFTLAMRNDNAVDCIDRGGMFGDCFNGITIKDGYFSIENGISGGQHWEQVITFKYDKAKNNWYLYKEHYVSYKMNDSDDTDAEALVTDSDELKTEKDFGIVPFEKYTTYGESGN